MSDVRIPICAECLGASHCGSEPDFPWRHAEPGEACGAYDHLPREGGNGGESDPTTPTQNGAGEPVATSTEQATAPVDAEKTKRLALSLGRAAAFFIADFMGDDIERAVARLIAEGKVKSDTNVVDLGSARRRLRPRKRDDDDGPGAA